MHRTCDTVDQTDIYELRAPQAYIWVPINPVLLLDAKIGNNT